MADLNKVERGLGSISHPVSDASIRDPAVTYLQWRTPTLIVVISWIVALGLFWDTTVSIVAIWWRSETFSHGFLILPISLYLVWARRHRVASLMPAPNLWGLLLLAGLGCGWLLGNLADVLVIQQLALVAMLPGLVWTVLGSPVTRILLFPLAFLFFAVPLGEGLVPPLQDFTAFFTVKALQLSGIPVFLEGRLLSLPSGMWEVAEACSGVRYVIPSVVLGCVFSFLTYQRWARRLGFILTSMAVPILANGVRAYGIVLLGHVSDNRIAVGVDHLIYGWLFFGVVMFLLFGLGLRWREPADRRPADVGQRSQSSPVQSAAMIHSGSSHASTAKALTLTTAGAVALLALAPIAAQTLSNRTATPIVIQAAAPEVNPPWTPLSQYTGNWVPRFIGADAEVTQSYTNGHQVVHLYMAYYTDQQQGGELINSENVIVNGKQWVWLAEGHTNAVVDGRTTQVHETLMRSWQGSHRLVWSGYWVAGEWTASPPWAKLLQAKVRLFGGPQGSAVIALGADYDSDRSEAADLLQDFLRHTSLLAALNGFST